MKFNRPSLQSLASIATLIQTIRTRKPHFLLCNNYSNHYLAANAAFVIFPDALKAFNEKTAIVSKYRENPAKIVIERKEF